MSFYKIKSKEVHTITYSNEIILESLLEEVELEKEWDEVGQHIHSHLIDKDLPLDWKEIEDEESEAVYVLLKKLNEKPNYGGDLHFIEYKNSIREWNQTKRKLRDKEIRDKELEAKDKEIAELKKKLDEK